MKYYSRIAPFLYTITILLCLILIIRNIKQNRLSNANQLDLPNINLPNINLPNLDLRNLDLKNRNMSIVSGYWVVHNKHNNKFNDWFSKTLRINCPYVFFGNKETIEMVKKYRHDLPTYYVHLELNDFVTSKYKNDFITDSVHVPSAELNMIWNEKVFLIQRAKELNPFKSDYFTWCDAGICIYREETPPIEPIPRCFLPKNKLIYTESNPYNESSLTSTHYHHVSGTWCMHVNIIDEFASIYKKYLHKLVPRKDNLYTDQVILTYIYKDFPELFYKIGSGYGELIKVLNKPKLYVPTLIGGLGNQLFTLLSVYFMAQDNGGFCMIRDSGKDHTSIDYTQNIFSKIENVKNNENELKTLGDSQVYSFSNRSNERDSFSKIVSPYNSINGYLQNYNHFHSHYDELLRLVVLPETPKESVFFLHVRLGDFKQSEIHIINLDNYYKKAIQEIKNKVTNPVFRLFSDEPENASKYMYNLVPDINILPATKRDELTELSAMRNCTLGGVAGHSTFAWWGGYLNSNKNKVIVIPNIFTLQNDTFEGMYYPGTTVVNV